MVVPYNQVIWLGAQSTISVIEKRINPISLRTLNIFEMADALGADECSMAKRSELSPTANHGVVDSFALMMHPW